MTMSHGPTTPEPATEGKDLSGGFIQLQISAGSYNHSCRVHVAPFSNSGGSLLYGTPPSGVFSDAGPDVTASGLMGVLRGFYPADWTLSLAKIFQVNSGVVSEVFPIPTVAAVAGNAANPPAGYVHNFASQMTFSTRDDHGNPFRFIVLSSTLWSPDVPQLYTADNAGGPGQRLVYFLATNGAIRSHAGNKPVAPMRMIQTLNNRLRREYRTR